MQYFPVGSPGIPSISITIDHELKYSLGSRFRADQRAEPGLPRQAETALVAGHQVEELLPGISVVRALPMWRCGAGTTHATDCSG